MTDTQSSLTQYHHDASDQHARQIDSGAWAVFFIWVGVVMLTGLAWAWFLVGVGALILGAQILRQQSHLKIDTFFLAVGIIILAAGVWDLLALPLPFIPIVLIAAGAYLLWKTLSSKTESP